MFSFILKEFMQIIFLVEPSDILSLGLMVTSLFNIDDYSNDSPKVKEKILEVIKFFLFSNLICVGEFLNPDHFQVWNLSPEESYIKIKQMWDDAGRVSYLHFVEIFWFGLTPKGFAFVKKNLKNQKIFAQKIILAAYKKDLCLKDLIKSAKSVFNTDVMDEIRNEIAHWANQGLQEVGFKVFFNKIFINYKKYSSFKNISPEDFILFDWKRLIDSSLSNWQLWFRNTPEVNKLVEKWKKDGGEFFTGPRFEYDEYGYTDSNLDEIEAEQRKRYKY